MNYQSHCKQTAADMLAASKDMTSLRFHLPSEMLSEAGDMERLLVHVARMLSSLSERIHNAKATQPQPDSGVSSAHRADAAKSSCHRCCPGDDTGECDLSEPMRPLPDANSGA